MWQRFSENARRTIFYAQEQAARFGTTKVSTEHLLLALLHQAELHQAELPGVWPPPPTGQVEAGNAVTFILRDIGADIDAIRAEVEQQTQSGTMHAFEDMELTTEAKRVIDLAYEEARYCNHNYIGPEHLLLGLISVEKVVSRSILAQFGIEREAVRAIVVKLPPIVCEQKTKGRTFWQILFGSRMTQG